MPQRQAAERTELAAELSAAAATAGAESAWPSRQLAACARRGVFAWFVPVEHGGRGWGPVEVTAGYLTLAKSCLTTAFVLTQWAAAAARVVSSANEPLRARLLPRLASGELFTTVAISHLSTSRRHLGAPVLRAIPCDGGYELRGYSAWVTGAVHAELIVVGATLADGREVLAVVPGDAPGLSADPPQSLVGLSGSDTGSLRLDGVRVAREAILAGPIEQVMRVGGAGTGGLQTSTLAVGLSDAALEYCEGEASARANLRGPTEALRGEWSELRADLLATAAGSSNCTAEAVRARANSLVLRATQAALVAAKGTGYVVGHPAGRWCREALFFLVWSCPQAVSDVHLCELAGLGGTHDD